MKKTLEIVATTLFCVGTLAASFPMTVISVQVMRLYRGLEPKVLTDLDGVALWVMSAVGCVALICAMATLTASIFARR